MRARCTLASPEVQSRGRPVTATRRDRLDSFFFSVPVSLRHTLLLPLPVLCPLAGVVSPMSLHWTWPSGFLSSLISLSFVFFSHFHPILLFFDAHFPPKVLSYLVPVALVTGGRFRYASPPNAERMIGEWTDGCVDGRVRYSILEEGNERRVETRETKGKGQVGFFGCPRCSRIGLIEQVSPGAGQIRKVGYHSPSASFREIFRLILWGLRQGRIRRRAISRRNSPLLFSGLR